MDLKKQNKYKGYKAEDLASSFLLNKGYQILEKNFLIRGGEIDLVAKKEEVLVFVEVKARYSHNFGLPEESITPWKLKSLLKLPFFITKRSAGGIGLLELTVSLLTILPTETILKLIIWKILPYEKAFF